jgi:hypothetical protein
LPTYATGPLRSSTAVTGIVEGSLLDDEDAGAADEDVEDADEPPALEDELDEPELPHAARATTTATSAGRAATRNLRDFIDILASQRLISRPASAAEI